MLLETAAPKRRRLSFKKASGWLHLWLGLGSGLIVLIVSLTGCIYVFEEEIQSVVYADRLYVEPGAAVLPMSVLWDKAQAALGKEYPIQRAQVWSAPDRSYAFGCSKSNKDAKTYFGETVYNYRVYVNPYDGAILKVENAKYEFFSLVLWTHWSLLLSNKIGQPIVGTAVLIFVALLITGLVLWWPRNKAALKARLQVAWKAKWKRLNWDLHAVPGFYTLSFALLISLTGLVWAFKWFNKSVYFVATGGGSPVKEEPLRSDTTLAAAVAAEGTNPLDGIFAASTRQMAGYREIFFFVPEKREATISAFARFGEHAHYKSTRMNFDRWSGRLLKEKSFADQNRGEKLRSLNYDLHTGSILGLPGKILAFLASFTCATLPVSGFFVWWNKRRKRKAPADARPGAGRGAGKRNPRAVPEPALTGNAT